MTLQIPTTAVPKPPFALPNTCSCCNKNQRRTPGTLMKGTVKTTVYASLTLVVATLAFMSHGDPLTAVSQRDPSVVLTPGAGDSMGPVLSRDGRYVVFGSSAFDLVPAQSPVSTRPVPGVLGVYMRDRLTGQTTLLSSNLPGVDTSLTSVSPIELVSRQSLPAA